MILWVDMVTGSNAEIFSATEFWVKFGKIEDFFLISTLAIRFLSFPISNVACERIFYKSNLLDTNQRSRFTVPGIAANIFAREGVCDRDNKNRTNFSQQKK